MSCRGCHSPLGSARIRLPQPERLGTLFATAAEAQRAGLTEVEFASCARCGLIQNTSAADPSFSHPATSSVTLDSGNDIRARLRQCLALSAECESGLAVDIGANDGEMLRLFADEGLRAVGVEPAPIDTAGQHQPGGEILHIPFDAQAQRQLVNAYGLAKIVWLRHSLEHFEDAGDALKQVAALLHPEGVAMIEVPELLAQARAGHIETLSSHHRTMFTRATLGACCRRSGLKVVAEECSSSDGGSIVMLARRGVPRLEATDVKESQEGLAALESLFTSLEARRTELALFCAERRRAQLPVFAFGAGSKGQYLLNLFRLTSDAVPFVLDDRRELGGQYIPCTANEVVAPDDERLPLEATLILIAPTHLERILAHPLLHARPNWRVYSLHPRLRVLR